MRGAALNFADAGIRVVSPKAHLTEAAFGAYVTHAGFTGDGADVVATFGDGCIRCMPAEDDPGALQAAEALGATPLVAAPDIDGKGILVGTDDGRLLRFTPGEGLQELARLPGAWIETVAAHKAAGLRAFSAGRAVYVLDPSAVPIAVFADHLSTPTGIAFSPSADRIAVSRYDGVSVWQVDAQGSAEELPWHGSHTALAWSPDGCFMVTAMQENELHCWRLADGKSLKMSGYTRKIRSLAWTSDSKYVAAGGAETVTSWRCDGDGPAGRAPVEIGYAYEGVVTRVAAQPTGHVVAGGYDDGTIMIGDVEKGDAVIARPGDGDAITALAWSPDGLSLIAGSAGGAVALIRVPESFT
jgi:WD40 repeat protein